MSNHWSQPPAHANPPRRSWYQKKRFLLPIIALVGLTIVGPFIDEPAGPSSQAQVVDSTVGASSTAEAALAEVKASATAQALATAKAERKAEAKAKAKAKARSRRIKARKARDRKAEERRLAEAAEAAAAETEAAEEEPSSVYYANCTAVRNAGAAPIRTGDPGYSRKLDRDGDGTACE